MNDPSDDSKINPEDRERALRIAMDYFRPSVSDKPPVGMYWSESFYGPADNYWFVYEPSIDRIGASRYLVVSKATGKMVKVAMVGE